jgi:hypothetical protein
MFRKLLIPAFKVIKMMWVGYESEKKEYLLQQWLEKVMRRDHLRDQVVEG